MCGTCGCAAPHDHALAGGQPATPGQAAAHGQAPHPGQAVAAHGRTLTIEQRVLARNDALAERNRAWLAGRGVLALNLMSSPGSGKTTLLERTIRDLGDRLPVAVIEGDQETAFDADRIRATGCQAVQVNTGSGCHLDAAMLSGALDRLRLTPGSVVFVENVGNLVCPALFDLGEARRVVITSVTEGADKPVKYPHMFRTADLVLLNKIDLLPYVGFSCEEFRARLRQVNPAAPVVTTSATRGDGVPEWLAWLREQTGEDGFP